LLLYGIYGFVDWFFISGPAERSGVGLLTKNLTDYKSFRALHAPRDIDVDPAVSLSAGNESQDVFARIENTNTGWWVEFDYQFTVPGAEVPVKHGFALPGEVRYLRELGIKAARSGSPELTIANLQWHRINAHTIQPNYPAWSASRLNFVIDNVKFVPPDPKDPLAISRATFTVRNDSAYSYWNVAFFVALNAGSSIVGVNSVTISELRAGESRSVDASWFNDLPHVDSVEVSADVNILDERVYIPTGR
ncbi:MAG: hypothetical protein AAB692_05690, partial [Patescibacteria group bacterium]